MNLTSNENIQDGPDLASLSFGTIIAQPWRTWCCLNKGAILITSAINVPYSCRLKRLMGLLRLRQELDVGWTSRVPLRTYRTFYVRDPFQNSFGGTSASLPRTVQISALWRVWVTLHLYTTVPLHFSPRQNLCRLCNPCNRCNPCNLLANLLPLTPRETRTET